MSLSHDKRESTVGAGREREGEECSSMSGCLNQKTNKERGYSRRGADGAQAERQMVWCALQVFLCIVRDCGMKDASMDLTLLSPPRTPYGGRKNHPSCGLCSKYSLGLNVQSVWTKIGTSYAIHPPSVCPCLPLYHYSITPAMVTIRSHFLLFERCYLKIFVGKRGVLIIIVSLAPRSRQPLSHFVRLPDAFSTY